jgi:hypothetical protein
MRRPLTIRRLILPAVYVAFALVCAFALDGGGVVLLFFGVWGGMWLGFARFSDWANRTTHNLLRDRGYE